MKKKFKGDLRIPLAVACAKWLSSPVGVACCFGRVERQDLEHRLKIAFKAGAAFSDADKDKQIAMLKEVIKVTMIRAEESSKNSSSPISRQGVGISDKGKP